MSHRGKLSRITKKIEEEDILSMTLKKSNILIFINYLATHQKSVYY